MKYLLFIFILLVNITSCQKKDKYSDNLIIAKINNESIYSFDIDTLIQQELYDELNRIYFIKEKALNAYLDIKVLEQEANKNGLSSDNYTNKYLLQKIESFGVDSLYKKYNIGEQIKIHSTTLYSSKYDSLGEKLSLKHTLKSYILRELLDSLIASSDIYRYLSPPKNPNICMKNIQGFYRGNMDSEITVYIISDFDCDKCIRNHHIYDSIYTNYKNRIKFGYVNFSSAPTLAQIACSAANEQGKFWDYHDSLYSHKGIIDSIAIFKIAAEINLDINKFNKDIRNDKIICKIENTIQELVRQGIFATPTIVINKRIVYNSNSYDEISHFIENELNNIEN